MKTSSAPTLTRLALGILLLGSFVQAHSEEAPPRAKTVQLTELDLNRPGGIQSAYKRISNAAEVVCPDHSREAQRANMRRQCIADAIERAVATLDVPALTAYHLDRTRQGGDPKLARE